MPPTPRTPTPSAAAAARAVVHPVVVVLAGLLATSASASPAIGIGADVLPNLAVDDVVEEGRVPELAGCAAFEDPLAVVDARTSVQSWSELGVVAPAWPDLRVSSLPVDTRVSPVAHPDALLASDAAIEALVALPTLPACSGDDPLPAEEWLANIGTPGRPFTPRERRNAEIIFDTFIEAGHGPGLALAAIVNAWAESALRENARMTQPFYWKGISYPRGTGAIGLFQLLPSIGGAGGPSGPERGYARTFLDGRWAGTPWQARRYGDTPDGAGRRYYDGTDPVINTRRILLEIERDGDRLVAAARRGASVAHLAYLFGRDIERPQNSTWHRKRLAVKMFGETLALSEHPDRLFLPPKRDFLVGGPTCSVVSGLASLGDDGDDGLASTD